MIVTRPLQISVANDSPTGSVDGVNLTFLTSSSFYPGTSRVYLNGVRQKSGSGNDYQEVGGNTLVFSYPPKAGDVILVDYTKA